VKNNSIFSVNDLAAAVDYVFYKLLYSTNYLETFMCGYHKRIFDG